MDGWNQMTLGELCTLRAGSVFKTHYQGQSEGEIPFVKVSDMNLPGNEICIREANHWVSEGVRAEMKAKTFPKGTTVFAKIGEALKQNRVRLLVRDTIIDNNMMGAIPKPNVVEPTFFFYRLSDFDIASTATGTALPYLTVSTLSQSRFTVPPLSIQRRIAAILSTYDDLIENNTRRIQILERMAQALYREWFVHFRFPGHAKVKLVALPLGTIPQGWTPGTLGDIAGEIRRGVNPDDIEPDTPYIGLEHIPRKSIALSEWGTAKEVQSTKLVFKKGEILFGKIRPYFHKVGVAVVDGVCSTDAIVIVPKKPEHFALVLACVSSEQFVSHATQTSQGTKMPRANWDVLTKYPLPLPPAPLLSIFSESVNDAVALIHNLVFKNRNLRRTRDLLLPKLISGTLDVSKLDIETA